MTLEIARRDPAARYVVTGLTKILSWFRKLLRTRNCEHNAGNPVPRKFHRGLGKDITSAGKDRKAKDGGRNWKQQRDDAVICA